MAKKRYPKTIYNMGMSELKGKGNAGKRFPTNYGGVRRKKTKIGREIEILFSLIIVLLSIIFFTIFFIIAAIN